MIRSIVKSFYIALVACISSSALYSQVEFYNGTNEVLGDVELTSTVCIGFNDLDGDWLDDLILLDNGKRLKTFIQNEPERSFEYIDHGPVSQAGEYALVSGDLNNDGVAEIIVSGNSNASKFLYLEEGEYEIQFQVGDIYSQNSNLVDINRDGFLDFFVCNDDGESLFFLNDGNGGMIQSTVVDFVYNQEEDLAGNYSSIFTDVNGDGFLDLYLGKCKAEASEDTDPRRINQLYINNGDGSFSEQSKSSGLAIGKQSWSVDSGDVDNDGDLDMIIANHGSPHDLMINDGTGKFTRMEMIPDGYTTFAFQSFFCDFDNNGWLDIVFTDPGNTFILFNDEMSFSRRDVVTSGQKAFSTAMGDLNFDGFPDLYLGFAVSFLDPGVIKDKVMLNKGNSNNFIDIRLRGTQSNRDAVGAKVAIYQGGKMQMREVVAGKSYGIMNSTVCHFGLGSTSSIDSIVVTWPTGMKSTHTDIEELNTLYTISEDGCMTSILKMPTQYLCDNESIDLVLPFGYESYLWSNGETSRNIEVDEAGWYRGEMVSEGCTTRTNYIKVENDIIISPSDVILNEDRVLCEGDFIKLEAVSGNFYDWSTGETSQTIDVFEPGEYSVTVQSNCGTLISNPVQVEFADVIQPEIENDTIEIGESGIFEGQSEELNWYQNKNDLEPIAEGSEFITPILVESQTYFVGEETSGFGLNTSFMSNVPLNSVGDSSYTENEFILFEVLAPIFLKSLSVRTQVEGNRRILILQGNNEVFDNTENLVTGINTINVGMELAPGQYRIGTDSNVNIANLGTSHPKFSYATFYAEKDRLIEGYFKLEGSELYPGVSPYFFNWNIDYGYYACEPRVPVYAVVKESVSTKDLELHVGIYPNPTNGNVIIESNSKIISVDVLDVNSNLISSSKVSGQLQVRVELPEKPGIYILRCLDGKSMVAKKVVKL